MTSNTTLQNFKLKNIPTEDLEDVLAEVESSFGVQFESGELLHIGNLGELCKVIAAKIDGIDSEDCSSQQAFYKLRNAISTSLQIDIKEMAPNTALEALLPKKNRRGLTKKLEDTLGFELRILRPPNWVYLVLVGSIIASFAVLFVQPMFGLIGLAFSSIGLYIANKTGRELKVQTLRQVAEKMTREHYREIRRNPHTINRKEIECILLDWFSSELVFAF
ncbi:MAG: hypothetical protein IT244_10100 [Bacteroidia bacterium]|nr:hypothetical protein [Bacteroidia bacterium]